MRNPSRRQSCRLAIAASLAWPLAARARESPQGVAARLFERAALANAAFMNGDMRRWLSLVTPIAPDFTLFQPFGGPASRGFDDSDAHLDEMSRYFLRGETRSELVASYATDDLVVLVVVERQRAEVGGLPAQDWSLRVTQVWRRDGEDWFYVHRHADPLATHIGLERASALADGGGRSTLAP